MEMQKTSLDELEAAKGSLAPFVARGFIVRFEEFNPSVFGNLVIELASPDLFVRLVRDRGQYFLDLRNPRDDEWFDEETVLRLIGETEAADDLVSRKWTSAVPAVAAICDRFAAILEAFSDARYQQTKAELQRLQRQRAATLFNHGEPPN
jgi:hypothetical protein